MVFILLLPLERTFLIDFGVTLGSLRVVFGDGGVFPSELISSMKLVMSLDYVVFSNRSQYAHLR